MKKVVLILLLTFLNFGVFAYTLDNVIIDKLNEFSKKMEKNIKSNASYIDIYKNDIKLLGDKYKSNQKAISILNYLSGKVYEYDRLMFRYDNAKMRYSDVDLNYFEQIGDLYLGSAYYKDNKNIYYEASLLKGANPSSFQLLTGSYSKDDKNVYYGDWKLDLNPNKLEILTGGFTKDDKNVYWVYVQITGADAATFEVTGRGLGKDKNRNYYGDDYGPCSGTIPSDFTGGGCI